MWWRIDWIESVNGSLIEPVGVEPARDTYNLIFIINETVVWNLIRLHTTLQL